MLKLFPKWSHQAIAKQIKCSHHFISRWAARHKQTSSVRNTPRSGRSPKAGATAKQHMWKAAKPPDRKTAGAIVAKVQEQVELDTSLSTAKRLLRAQGLQHLAPRVLPILADHHKADKLRLAVEAQDFRENFSVHSKYFYAHNMSKPAASWCTPVTRGTVATSKHSVGAHVYMGMSWRVTTKLMFVTGTQKQKCKYIDPRTKRLKYKSSTGRVQ